MRVSLGPRQRISNRQQTNRGLAPIAALAFFTGTLMRMQKPNLLINPRGLRTDYAAAYMGMSKTKFLESVDKGTIPRAVTIDGIKIWDRFDLDAVIDAAKEHAPSENNSFDKIMGR